MSTSSTSTPAFPIWKTITLGPHRSVEDLRKALTGNGFLISHWAADLLKRTPLDETGTEIELVLVSAADLGFTKATRRDKIYACAKKLGLSLVPAEAGAQLRLAYSDQPMGEWVLVGMEPIAISDGGLDVFFVGRRESGLWLITHYGGPGIEWDPGVRWVFARRKQK